MHIDFENILSRLNKPARYLGNEVNSIKKDLSKVIVKAALCFPDLYEIGMSHLGFRIIYGVLNAQVGCACERVFSPARDLENILRSEHIPLFSLESKFPLKEFDILGFSLCYELNYTNVLNVLDLAGLPLRQDERLDVFPLVIAGGNSCLNPEPLADFFDLFVIGEAEEAILEIVNIIKEYKLKNKLENCTKKDLLQRLALVEGVYVPSLYNVKYFDSGSIREFSFNQGVPKKITKRFIKDLDASYYPTDWVVPYISIVHDRISLEIMRGCPNKCFFCQARSSFLPLRIRSLNTVTNLIDSLYKSSGYEEVSLLSLSSSDYPYICELVESLMDKFKDKAIGISLPSLRAKSIVGDLVEFIRRVRKTSLTFAPEAGTERLRRYIGKNFDIKDLLCAIKNAKDLGYRQVKLYFMIGLPAETKEDIDGIIDLACGISTQNKIKMTLSVSNFIPKPHTPFQWLGMDSIESIKQKQRYIKSNVARRTPRVKIGFHDVHMSYLECVFTRGDRRLSKVIFNAFKDGARFDSWHNDFNFNLWENAFKINSINSDFYCRHIDLEEILPWDYIDVGVSKDDLLTRAKAHQCV